MLSLWVDQRAAGFSGRLGRHVLNILEGLQAMVCAISAESILESPAGEVAPMFASAPRRLAELGDLPLGADRPTPWFLGETAEGDDPFDDFDEDDFDDDFDDDFEEDWEDDLTEDEEFPDTFGGNDPDEEIVETDEEDEDSPFADDPDFDDA
jgi:hypothetical protein